jgi:hypothetical protein
MNDFFYKKMLCELKYLDALYNIIRNEIEDRLPEYIKKKMLLKKNDTLDEKNKEAGEPQTDPLDFIIDCDKSTEKKIKSLYRQISRSIHPDKTNDLKKQEDFNIVTKGKCNGNMYKMCIVADTHKINIDIKNEHIDILKKEIKLLQNKIKIMENHVVFRMS